MSGGVSATTLAGAGLGLAAVGTGISAFGAIQNAQAQSASANYQSEVAASNQKIATQNADYAAASGEQQAANQEQKTRQQIGEIEAGQGSSGVDINSSTSKAVVGSQDVVGQLDAQTIRSNAARQAYGYETQATNFGNQASAETSQAQNDITGGYVNSGAGLLSGIGNASLNYASVMNNSTGLGDASAYVNASPQEQVAYDITQGP